VENLVENSSTKVAKTRPTGAFATPSAELLKEEVERCGSKFSYYFVTLLSLYSFTKTR